MRWLLVRVTLLLVMVLVVLSWLRQRGHRLSRRYSDNVGDHSSLVRVVHCRIHRHHRQRYRFLLRSADAAVVAAAVTPRVFPPSVTHLRAFSGEYGCQQLRVNSQRPRAPPRTCSPPRAGAITITVACPSNPGTIRFHPRVEAEPSSALPP